MTRYTRLPAVVLCIVVLGGLGWWYAARTAPLVLSPEARRHEARAFLKLAVAEARNAMKEPSKGQYLAEVAPAQAAAGDVPGAAETAAAIEDAFGQSQTWIALAAARFKAGDAAGGRRFFAAVIGSEELLVSNPVGLGVVPSSLAAAQAAAGEIEAAVHTAVTIEDPFDRATAWGAVAVAQAKAGDAEGSRWSFALAGETARVTGEVVAWRELAVAQAKAGDAEGRDRSFALAIEAARAYANPDDRARHLAMIAQEQAEAGDAARARRTLGLAAEAAQTIPGEDDRSSTLAVVAFCQAAGGDLTGAAQAMGTLHGDADKNNVRRYLALVQAGNKDLPAALATVQTVAGQESQVEILRELAVQQAQAGDGEGSQRVFALAIETARAGLGGDGLRNALDMIASEQASAGDPAGALRTMAASGDHPNQQEVWSDIAVALAKAGDAAGAEKIARRLQPETGSRLLRAWDRFLLAIGRPPHAFRPVVDPQNWEQSVLDCWTKAVSAVARAHARAGEMNAAAAAIEPLPRGAARCKGYQEAAAGLLEAPTHRDGH